MNYVIFKIAISHIIKIDFVGRPKLNIMHLGSVQFKIVNFELHTQRC